MIDTYLEAKFAGKTVVLHNFDKIPDAISMGYKPKNGDLVGIGSCKRVFKVGTQAVFIPKYDEEEKLSHMLSFTIWNKMIDNELRGADQLRSIGFYYSSITKINYLDKNR